MVAGNSRRQVALLEKQVAALQRKNEKLSDVVNSKIELLQFKGSQLEQLRATVEQLNKDHQAAVGQLKKNHEATVDLVEKRRLDAEAVAKELKVTVAGLHLEINNANSRLCKVTAERDQARAATAEWQTRANSALHAMDGVAGILGFKKQAAGIFGARGS